MIGIIFLTVVSILIFLGLAHRVLDRLYLTDRSGLFFIGAMIIGSFIDIPLWNNPKITLNVGGGLLPLFLAIYVLFRAGSSKEVWRSIAGIILTTGILYGVNRLYRFDTAEGFIEPQYLWAVIAALVGYLIGRSRRLSFIVATLGILALDIVHIVETAIVKTNAATRIGGAGVFDTLVIAGVLAVLLAELVGETRESLQGGPASEGKAPELLAGLTEPDNYEEEEK